MRIDTGVKSPKKFEQHKGRPQAPIPFSTLASSRTPTWRNSMRVLNIVAKSLTSSRKSIRPSAVKKNIILFISNVYSTLISFIGNLRFSIFSRQISKAFSSRSLFFSICFKSFDVACLITGLTGATTESSKTSLGPITTVPYSTPRAVSTITPSPTDSSNCSG